MSKEREKTTSEKIWHFVESPILWGGLGLLGGAIIVLIPVVGLKYIFGLAWVLFVITQLREKFWYGSRWPCRIVGNVFLAGFFAALLVSSWHYIPKPKEPPTPDEIADAYFRKYGQPKTSESSQPTIQPQPMKHAEGKVREDGKQLDVAIGPSPEPTYAYETRFILSNRNSAKLANTFYVCETQKVNKNNKMPGLIVKLTDQPSVFQGMVGDLSPGYSFSMYCDFTLDLWANELERPELNLWVHYQYGGRSMKRGFKFLAIPSQDGNHTFSWLQRGEAEEFLP
jgi:hypothetical protein